MYLGQNQYLASVKGVTVRPVEDARDGSEDRSRHPFSGHMVTSPFTAKSGYRATSRSTNCAF